MLGGVYVQKRQELHDDETYVEVKRRRLCHEACRGQVYDANTNNDPPAHTIVAFTTRN
jgi:hypothetical protein